MKILLPELQLFHLIIIQWQGEDREGKVGEEEGRDSERVERERKKGCYVQLVVQSVQFTQRPGREMGVKSSQELC